MTGPGLSLICHRLNFCCSVTVGKKVGVDYISTMRIASYSRHCGRGASTGRSDVLSDITGRMLFGTLSSRCVVCMIDHPLSGQVEAGTVDGNRENVNAVSEGPGVSRYCQLGAWRGVQMRMRLHKCLPESLLQLVQGTVTFVVTNIAVLTHCK